MFQKGYTPWNKGKPAWNKGKTGLFKHTKEWKEMMKEKRIKRKKELGYINTQEAREKMKLKAIGRKHTEETKRKISEISKNRPFNPKFTTKGLTPWNKGIKFSFTPQIYSDDWKETLRESIRERDNFMCQICGLHQDELSGWHKKLAVHHIDYDKFNCNPNNLITLCNNCHAKTNFNREYWIKYFSYA